ncbi:hypothetical protein HRbin34_00275 [bacterium HR34]|nr:hypothetical protein HRbin34_00275 [bacterium HR34]
MADNKNSEEIIKEKLNLIKLEFSNVQSQIDKYDKIENQIKSWSITLWVALIGWSF